MSGRRKKWLQRQFKARYGRWPVRSSKRQFERGYDRTVRGIVERFIIGRTEIHGVHEIRALKARWRAYLRSGRKGVFTV